MIQRWLALTYYLYALRLAALSHFYFNRLYIFWRDEPIAGSLHLIKSKSSVKIDITAIGQRAGVYQIIGGGVKHLCRFGLDFGLGKRADFGGDGTALLHGEIIG